MSKLVTVSTYLDTQTAHVSKGLLESSGIHAVVMADDAGGNRP